MQPTFVMNEVHVSTYCRGDYQEAVGRQHTAGPWLVISKQP